MSPLKASILFFSFGFAFPAIACSPPPELSADEISNRAYHVLVGYVVGTSYPDMEAHIVSGGNPDETPFPSKFQIRVAFTKALRGNMSKPIQLGTRCFMPMQLGERVLIARFREYDYIVSKDQEIPLTALLKQRRK